MYCRMLQGEHSAILSTFVRLAVVIKTFVLSFLSGRFYLYIAYLKKNVVVFLITFILTSLVQFVAICNRNDASVETIT